MSQYIKLYELTWLMNSHRVSHGSYYWNCETGRYIFLDAKDAYGHNELINIPKIDMKEPLALFLATLPTGSKKAKLEHIHTTSITNWPKIYNMILRLKLWDDWNKFEQKYNEDIAIEWCQANNIKYSTKEPPDNHWIIDTD